MIFLRRQLPLLITFVTGVLFAAQYYVPHPRSEFMLTEVTKWLQIIGGFALVLGVTSLFHIHAVKIRRKEPGWGYSLVLYAGILGTIAAGFSYSFAAGQWVNGKETINGIMTAFGWVYLNMMVPLQGSMFALLADVTQWILNVLNAAVRRAILIGISLGAIALSLKIIFGIERAYLGGGKE